MVKTITTLELRNMGGALFQVWNSQKGDIKLSGKNLHALLSLKRSIEQNLAIVEETIASLALQFGGEQQENGAITIPADQRQAANVALSEYSKETITLEYKEIVLNENDVIPMDIFEAILDFVVFEENDVCEKAEK